MKSRGLLTLAAFGAVATMTSFSVAAYQAIGVPQGPNAPHLVAVVGCLEQTADGWALTKAAEPVDSKSPGTTQTAIKEADNKALGSLRFRLLGMGLFAPDTRKGQKVEVRGILIPDPKDNRVNVTSLQTVNASCAK